MLCRSIPTQISEHQTLLSSSTSFLKSFQLPFSRRIIYPSDVLPTSMYSSWHAIQQPLFPWPRPLTTKDRTKHAKTDKFAPIAMKKLKFSCTDTISNQKTGTTNRLDVHTITKTKISRKHCLFPIY